VQRDDDLIAGIPGMDGHSIIITSMDADRWQATVGNPKFVRHDVMMMIIMMWLCEVGSSGAGP
jgi:hypothetical protein